MMTHNTMLALVVAGTVTLVAGAVLPASAAVPTPDHGHCKTWQDSTTFGASCTGGGRSAYQAVAVCNNGNAVGGPYEGGESGNWSYASCARVNSSLKSGYVNWYL
jgi:hypothetical protein